MRPRPAPAGGRNMGTRSSCRRARVAVGCSLETPRRTPTSRVDGGRSGVVSGSTGGLAAQGSCDGTGSRHGTDRGPTVTLLPPEDLDGEELAYRLFQVSRDRTPWRIEDVLNEGRFSDDPV